MPMGFLWKIAGGAGTRGNLGSEEVVFCSNYGPKADIDGPRKSDHWLRDKNRWLEEVKKTTTNHRNES